MSMKEQIVGATVSPKELESHYSAIPKGFARRLPNVYKDDPVYRRSFDLVDSERSDYQSRFHSFLVRPFTLQNSRETSHENTIA